MRERKARKARFLDGEVLFKSYWEEMGTARSIAKLADKCRLEGVRNPKTGKAPTRMALWFSMWNWALQNPDEAYDVFNRGLKLEGDYCSPEEWKEYLLDKAKTALSERRYEEYKARVSVSS